MYSIFEYNGNKITFRLLNGMIMINATEMAKQFNKQPVHFLSLNSTISYCDALSKLRNLSLADLQIVNRGGNNPGSWLHQDLAIEFARWLSPKFSIWCNDRILELLINGNQSVSLPNFEDPADAAIAWAEQYKLKQLAESKVKELTPKAEVYTQIADSTNLISIGDAAKSLNLGYGRNTLFEILRGKNILIPKVNTPYQKYINSGYFLVKINTFNTGSWQEKPTTYVTGKGMVWLAKILKES